MAANYIKTHHYDVTGACDMYLDSLLYIYHLSIYKCPKGKMNYDNLINLCQSLRKIREIVFMVVKRILELEM